MPLSRGQFLRLIEESPLFKQLRPEELRLIVILIGCADNLSGENMVDTGFLRHLTKTDEESIMKHLSSLDEMGLLRFNSDAGWITYRLIPPKT